MWAWHRQNTSKLDANSEPCKIYVYCSRVCQVYKHMFVIVVNIIVGCMEMCRLDHFQNDRDVIMNDMLLSIPPFRQTHERTLCQNHHGMLGQLKNTMPKFERDFFRYEFEVSDDWSTMSMVTFVNFTFMSSYWCTTITVKTANFK